MWLVATHTKLLIVFLTAHTFHDVAQKNQSSYEFFSYPGLDPITVEGFMCSNLREAKNMFKKHFEYFSATLSQVCIQHD